jgi:hypothetical protein
MFLILSQHGPYDLPAGLRPVNTSIYERKRLQKSTEKMIKSIKFLNGMDAA